MNAPALTKIGCVADLTALREQMRAEKSAAVDKDGKPRQILVCFGGSCLASGAKEVRDALRAALEKEGLGDQVALVETGCMGPCVIGPVVLVGEDRTFYQGVKPDDAAEIVASHICAGKRVERLLVKDPSGKTPEPCRESIDFFKRQTQIVLRNCGWIDPERIGDYVARDGYAALAKVLTEMAPAAVIEEMNTSGLRGRGGAGFPTWLKWHLASQTQDGMRYVLCNADEGDPGAYMDRSVLEGDPHSVIEGMAIAAFAIGAPQGYVYVRAEYPLAVERLSTAIVQARACGLLGQNIFGTPFSFDLEIRMGSGAFVCGEETALMASIEGKRGEPRPRPPFPAHKGLWGRPTVLNNVETYANVPAILLNGGAWYASLGTPKSKGTKVFALAGAVRNTGLVEVPIGTPLGELIFDIGGGIRNNRHFKAAQIGGPSGGCIPRENLNVALDYETLSDLGAIMGSGGLIVMDEDTCMVDVARFFIEFVQEESCGKCVPCRVGTRRMLEILERICAGKGEEGDIERLIELGNFIKTSSLCGLGQTAPNPVLSTIRHFRHEYEEHIRDRHCRAGVCAELVRAPCLSACPAGVNVPGFVSLVGDKRYAEALRLHREKNPFASVCARVCFHTCEEKCRRASLDEPVSIRGVKRFMVDQEVTVQVPEVRENAENAKRKIAVVGAGPAGLSCAYFLARMGYKPDVFESEPRPGGMLVQAIPAYRLPREELAREVRMIEHLGVNLETGKTLGRDFTLSELKEKGYEAVFLAIGAALGVSLDVPGSDAQGVTEAMHFLRQYNIRGSVPVGKRVAVIGGGNAAIDAARTAIRLGSESVTVLYRRTREEMPAYAEEIEEALQEGVTLRTLIHPESFDVKNGRVTGVRCRAMKLGEFDRSGRRRPEDASDVACEVIPVDQVIVAIGQALDVKTLSGGVEVDRTERGWIKADSRTGGTSVPWLFAGGDAVSGPSSVVEAIAAGERTAVAMDKLLSGGEHAFWRGYKDSGAAFDPNADPVTYARERLQTIALEKRRQNFTEVEQPWNENTALRQAKRCLRCDYGKQPCDHA
ncbi:MAG TPA: NADH-ubiquinone oxidoreductase-F iron-sulfur binding region domain-containing protein [Kiritimatiellia bacterium]|nr:NADH-ubiquinone oxidoreductase-F iron-sulfur binding region domain-containing protein [Kiritimatiellia bacterium]HPS08283.1 NADH-ubiquinone oxidoreductase-F iron-sulfur binding region domain-containing protein [Kiritimatiellia bacterium]